MSDGRGWYNRALHAMLRDFNFGGKGKAQEDFMKQSDSDSHLK